MIKLELIDSSQNHAINFIFQVAASVGMCGNNTEFLNKIFLAAMFTSIALKKEKKSV